MNYKDIIRKYRKPSKKGFSLVEVIAVVCILAVVSGATLTVFLMVHDVQRDASEVTVDQYNTMQMERLIRNELQVASNIDVVPIEAVKPMDGKYPNGEEVQQNDEYIIFDGKNGRVSFMRAKDDLKFASVYTMSDIQSAEFSIGPIDMSKDPSGQPYKIFYTLTSFSNKNGEAARFNYSGGIVLGNTCFGGKDDKTFALAKADPNFGKSAKFKWEKAPTGASAEEAKAFQNNGYVIFFHRNVTEVVSSTP